LRKWVFCQFSFLLNEDTLARDQERFEQFLTTLKAKVVSITNVAPSWTFGGIAALVYYRWIIEKVNQTKRNANLAQFSISDYLTDEK
jgi:hypothetical protein